MLHLPFRRRCEWAISPWWPWDSRQLMRLSLLRILAIAHDQHIDPATLVANLADEHRGTNRRLLRRLAQRIASGTPLLAALEQTPEILSDQQVLAIRFGTQSGTLSASYRDLLAKVEPVSAGWSLYQLRLYLAAMALVVLLSMIFLAVRVYPVLDAISDEFSAEPPWIYRLVSHVTQHYGVLILIVLAAVVILAALLRGTVLQRRFRRRIADPRLAWIQQIRMAELLELLSQSVQAGRPLSGALSILARYHFDSRLRMRLLFARNEVEQGAEVWTSLRDAKLLNPGEATALAASSSPQSRAWLMQKLAAQKRRRVTLLAGAAARAIQAVAVLLIATVVLALSLTVYQYLNKLILSGLQ